MNTYYSATAATVSAGATSIPVGAPIGAATPIAAGDLLLVIQMQGADINATNTDSYGNGVAGAPASGYTALGSSGLYEYVLATSGVVAGSVGISGTGPGAGLLNTYTQAAATATTGQRTFQVVRVPAVHDRDDQLDADRRRLERLGRRSARARHHRNPDSQRDREC